MRNASSLQPVATDDPGRAPTLTTQRDLEVPLRVLLVDPAGRMARLQPDTDDLRLARTDDGQDAIHRVLAGTLDLVLLALDPASARGLALLGHLRQISGGSYLAASPATGSAVSCGSTPPRNA